MTEVLATLGPCCGILRRGMEEPSVMHNGLCREKHDGCLGPTIYLVDAAEVERLRAELAECKRDAERYRWLREKIENDDFVIARVSDWGFTSWSGDDPDRYIDEALAAKGE